MFECAKLFLGPREIPRWLFWCTACEEWLAKQASQYLQIVFVLGFGPHPHAHVGMCKIIFWNLVKYQDDFVDAQHVSNDLQISKLLLCFDFGRTHTYMCDICASVQIFFFEPREIPRWVCWCTACEEWLANLPIVIVRGFWPHPHTHVRMCEIISWNLGKCQDEFVHVRNGLQIFSVWGFRPNPHANCTCFSELARMWMCEIISWDLGKYQDDFIDAQHVRNGLQNGRHRICKLFLYEIWAAPACTCANVQNYFLEPWEIPRWLRWYTVL